jgi:threonylcarbamoyladenosine tRNA methylthiotransferase MtaB
MRRRYKRELYAQRVAKIKELMPHCCIGVDAIVGFPNETEEDFLETYQFINELDISYLHVFTYSERPNTAAAEMPNPVSIEDRRKRNKMLTILSEKKRRFFYENHLNEVRPVLFEKAKERGLMSGFTDNYIKVEVPIKESFLNQIRPVKLLEIGDNGQVKIELKEVTEMVG